MPKLWRDGCRFWRLGLLILLIAAALAAWPVYRHLYVKPYDKLFQNAHAIQLALERYAVDNDNAYPTDIQQLKAEGYITHLPDNPFGKGNMKPLGAGEPWEAGAFIYVPRTPLVWSEDLKAPLSDQSYIWLLPERLPTLALPAPAPDFYTIVFYAPRQNPKLKQLRDAWLIEEAKATGSASLYAPPNDFEIPGVDWQHAAYMLSSGSGFK